MSPDHDNHTRRRLTGFSLIELMVVVLIIGILTALVVTVIPKVKTQVATARTSAQLSALANAIQQYYNDFKAYPGPLPNNEIASGWDSDRIRSPFPVGYSGGFLTGSSPFTSSQYNPTNLNYGHITGTQNLTLGLLGGLEPYYDTNTPPDFLGFIYNPQDITSDGVTPAPRGPASLNPATPRRQNAYIQVNQGDLSIPNINYNNGVGASFADSAGRSPSDAMIPVFLDKYSEPLPILYFRTNVGATAIVGFRNSDDNGNLLTDNVLTNPVIYETPQYDLRQVQDYTRSNQSGSGIGTVATNPNSFHGLQGAGPQNLTGTIMAVPTTGAPYFATGLGYNGIAYLRDPNFRVDTTNSGNSYDPFASNTHAGVARQKDGFLLISAGPDRLYGTNDDVIFPGSVTVAQ